MSMRPLVSILMILVFIQMLSCHDQDFTKSFKDICTENGYSYEEHKVTTKDGYINTLFRIPGKLSQSSNKKNPPVFFQHGILDSADGWIMNVADVAPAFVVASYGYDVWLGNSRGNKYSMAHTSLDPKKSQYWQFGWEEMGDYDLPANLDYITKTTGYAKTIYIGHSQGTTQLFYALSKDESYYASKISLFIATGPVTNMKYSKSELLSLIAENDALIIDVCNMFGIYDMFPANYLDDWAMQILCGYIPALCDLGVSLICDEDPSLDNQVRLSDYTGGHFPSGTSLKCLEHYGQIITSGEFRRYDYGKNNYEVYGQSNPPTIELSNIKGKVPIAMFVGLADELADTQDAEWAHSQMGNAVIFYHEYNLGHLSFMVGLDMSWFTVDAMTLIQKYQPLKMQTEQ